MEFSSQHITYRSTGFFSEIIVDYINGSAALEPFYSFAPDIAGIKEAIEARKKYPTNRKLLVEVLKTQYAHETLTDKQQLNIEQLNNSNCFTITTAHQPNIFTGHLYFLYKILHAIKLADELAVQLPQYDFVPVFYMGSEDADLDELGHIYLFGEKYEWTTKQTGAVGRMKVDKPLINLLNSISGQLTVYPFGEELIALLKACYIEGVTIEQATIKLINALFGKYGLIVLLPDNQALKKAFIPVIEKELAEGFSHKAVKETAERFPKEYKVQASGRQLNLFYLNEDLRERLEVENIAYKVVNSPVKFTKEEIGDELHKNPERFSPNVILRPVYQEMILPNIAFIGGGGEIAYWLELKKVFEELKLPFPVLVLRNSFMLINKELNALKEKLQFSTADLFKRENELINELVKRNSTVRLNLDKEKRAVKEIYQQLKNTAAVVDLTLGEHTEALQTLALKKIEALEKKMLRAEKKKFEAQQRQLHKLRSQLFPGNSLQERIQNFIPFYAKWGKDFIEMFYKNSLGLEEQFTVLTEV
jgi:bacillithiol biosynthesis cysteine-adding enzyme BshC